MAKTLVAKAGEGYHTGEGNFRRLPRDTETPVRLAPDEYAKPSHIIAYRLDTGERMHLRRAAIIEREDG